MTTPATTPATTLVIFGASGDLTSRKLIPSLYCLFIKGRLPKTLRIVGTSRTPLTDAAWRDQLRNAVQQFLPGGLNEATWTLFAEHLFYQPGDISLPESFASLDARLKLLEGAPVTRVYYFSTSPNFYCDLAANLAAAGMLAPPNRVVIEKPFGRDITSAQNLDSHLHSVMDESQVFRIDHYLGKETVSNILALRFANAIFEPLWNSRHISAIQITAGESGTIGHRAGYYDTAGILRDMVQNHLLQVLTFVAMEPPSVLSAQTVRDEKVKLLQAIPPLTPDAIVTDTLRGQYDGYLEEPGVSAESRTATFAAIKLTINNWRWKGVPVFLRTGKGMSCRTTQVVIDFKEPPHTIYDAKSLPANRLLLQLQPAEGIELSLQTKVPDRDRAVRNTSLRFNFRDSFRGEMPDSYERLLLDAIAGDASLFARSDEVEAAWRIIDPIQRHWDAQNTPTLEQYTVGNWGPESAPEWIATHGAEWFDMCPLV